MSQRLTRKEIKEDIRHDELTTALEVAIQRFQENKNLILGSVAALLVAGVTFAGASSWIDARSIDAQEELAEVIRTADAPVTSGEDAASDLSFATEEMKRSELEARLGEVGGGPGKADAADLASLYEARLALESGDTAKARTIWEDFLSSQGDHAVAVSVRVHLLRLDRAEGKAEQVAESLRSELEKADRSIPEDVVLFELGETLRELDRESEAIEMYQRLLDEHPRSSYTGDARRHVTES